MKILSFLGLFPTLWLLFSTYMLAGQICDSIGCACDLEILNRDFYVLAGFLFFLFFLIYCLLFLFKISASKKIEQVVPKKVEPEKIEITTFIHDDILDQGFHEEETVEEKVVVSQQPQTMHQLSWVVRLAKTGLAVSFGLLLFAFFAIPYIECHSRFACEDASSCFDKFSYEEESYILSYGGCGIYFLILTCVGLLKSFPSNFNLGQR